MSEIPRGVGAELRRLERSYRAERGAIIGDESRSWEARMRAVSELFERYAAERDKLEEEGAA